MTLVFYESKNSETDAGVDDTVGRVEAEEDGVVFGRAMEEDEDGMEKNS